MGRERVVAVIDTSVLVRDFRADSADMCLLESVGYMLGVRVVVPRVVLDEFGGHCKERAMRLQQRSSSFRKEVRRLLGAPGIGIEPPKFDTRGAAAIMLRRLESRCDSDGWEVAGYPQVSHEQVVSRLQAGKKPFGGSNGREVGYRDYLIWRTVLEIASESSCPVVLVTENTKDFLADGGGLHPDLAEEVGGQAVEVVQGLPAFCSEWLRSTLTGENESSDVDHWAQRIDGLFSSDEFQDSLFPDSSLIHDFGLPFYADSPMLVTPFSWEVESAHVVELTPGPQRKVFASVNIKGLFGVAFYVDERLAPRTRYDLQKAWRIQDMTVSGGEAFFVLEIPGTAVVEWTGDPDSTSPEVFFLSINPRPVQADFD